MAQIQYIAQSFSLDMKQSFKIDTSGYFVSGVDLYFSAKDPNFPVTVELREVDSTSNLVTNKYLPFSRVYQQSNNINISTDGSKPTPFLFEGPVYLEDKKEYAIVVLPGAGSPNYRVWTSRLGETDKITGNRITEQPSVGMLYASGVPVPEEDLKFRLYIAKFDTSTSGRVVLKNEPRDYFVIANSAGGILNRVGEVVHGPTRITGTFANTKSMAAVANGSFYAQGANSGAKGVLTNFNSGYIVVKDVTTTKFQRGEFIRLRSSVGTGGFNAGTGTIVGNSSPTITTMTPKGTVAYYDDVNTANVHLHVANVSYTYTGATACTANRLFMANTYIKGQNTGYTTRILSIYNVEYNVANFQARMMTPSNTTVYAEGKFAKSTSTRDSNFFRINLNDDTEFDAPRYVLSRSNEANSAASSAAMTNDRSVELAYILTSNNIFASPVIDLRQTSATTVLNLINSDTAIGNTENNVASGGLAQARYITRKVVLADGQDAEDLRVYLTAYKPTGSDVYVYYKILHADDNDSFDQARWVKMDRVTDQGFTGATAYSSSSNKNDFLELAYGVPAYTNIARSGANTTNSSIVEYRNSAKARFVGYKYFAIKIVLTNQNSSNPPRVKDLRAIALQR